jgi:hypothetical protein
MAGQAEVDFIVWVKESNELWMAWVEFGCITRSTCGIGAFIGVEWRFCPRLDLSGSS